MEHIRRLPRLISRAFWFLLWLIVGSIRVLWLLYITTFVLAAVFVLALLILDGALWLVPILAVFGFAVFVLFRNRWRRQSAR